MVRPCAVEEDDEKEEEEEITGDEGDSPLTHSHVSSLSLSLYELMYLGWLAFFFLCYIILYYTILCYILYYYYFIVYYYITL